VSLHNFEYTDLAGDRNWHQLCLDAAGTLSRVSGGSLTTLSSGFTLEGEQLVEAAMLNRLHLTSENQRGLATGGVKYDGSRITNWGVVAPGQTPTVIEAFDSGSGWTDSTDADSSLDTSVFREGAGSLRVDKTGTATNTAYVEKLGLGPLNWNSANNPNGTLSVWLFLPYGALQKLATAGAAVQVLFSSTINFTDSVGWQWSVGELLPGWNLLTMVLASPDVTNAFGWNIANVTGYRFQLIFSSTSQTLTHARWDSLYQTDRAFLSGGTSGAGPITGSVTYRTTFVTEFGVESNMGAASASISCAANQVLIGNIPVSSDPQVIARRLYRDLDGDQIYRFVMEISDNSTLIALDNIAEASLGGATGPIAGDDELDSSPPVRMRDVTVYGNRVFGIDGDNPCILHIGEVGQPEAFRLVDQLTFEEELVALREHGLGLLLYGRDRMMILLGDGVTYPFRAEELNHEIGADTPQSVCRAKGIHLSIHEKRVYQVVDPIDPWFISGPRHDVFEALAANTLIILHDRPRMRILFFIRGTNVVHVFQYGTLGFQEITGDGPGTDPLDLRVGAWWTLELPSSVKPLCAALIEPDGTSAARVWIGCDDNRIYYLTDPSVGTYATAGGAEAVSAEFETHDFPLGSSVSQYPGAPASRVGRGEPRFIEMSTYSTASTTWTVTVTLTNSPGGDAVATKVMTVTPPTGDESVIFPVDAIGVRAPWARIKIAQATDVGQAAVKALKIHYIPRTRFHGARS
jgi:hypothetical protein